MVEPKQKPASKPVHTADQARIPRTAMRAVWLRTREGTRQLLAEDCRDGQYQDAADREERAVDAVSSLTESATGAALRGGKKLAQQAAQKRRSEKAAGQAAQTAGQAMGAGAPPSTALSSEANTRSVGAGVSELHLIIIGKASPRRDNQHYLPRKGLHIRRGGWKLPISTRAACGRIPSTASS